MSGNIEANPVSRSWIKVFLFYYLMEVFFVVVEHHRSCIIEKRKCDM